MAVLVALTSVQEKPPWNNIGDVIGVHDESHVWNAVELATFTFQIVTGSRADVQRRINQMRPVITKAFLWISTGEYSLDEPEDSNNGGELKVWSTLTPPIRWYELVDMDKFIISIADLTAQEKAFISDPGFDINHSSVDSYIKKLIKDLGRKSENTVEITELRGETP